MALVAMVSVVEAMPVVASKVAVEVEPSAKSLPHLAVLGGCCGTDVRHVWVICEACL